MSDKSAFELERDAEIARARLADTAESIRNKMSPGQLIDEFTGLFTGGDGAVALHNLKAQIRDNPLPLTLVGAGLAWLILGEGAASIDRRENQDQRRASQPLEPGSSEVSEGSIGEALSETAASMTSLASGAADAALGITRAASATATHYTSGAAGVAGRATRSAQDLFRTEPLVLAALGLAAGTAIGVMLPHTAVEDEQMGRYGDKVRDTAEALLHKGMEEAKAVAAETYQTVKEEADRQGLGGDGDKSIVEQVGNVVKTAAAKTEDSIRDKVGSGSDQPGNT